MEKQTEYKLRNILYNNTKEEFIFESTKNNKFLHDLFKNASKKLNNNRGYPDCVYYDKNKLIIFECKYNDLQQANNEVKIYV